MKLSKLVTYFDADDAFTVITFLDQLQELLCNAYGNQIAIAQRGYREPGPAAAQLNLDLEDPF